MHRFMRSVVAIVGGIAALSAATGLSAALAHQEQDAQRQGVTAGDKAPAFTLKDVDGKEYSLEQILAKETTKAVVLEWFNPDCPYVKKHHQNHDTMKRLARTYAQQGVVWLAINSGAPGMQGAGVERNKKAIEDYGIAYPVLMDTEGTVGRAYGAKRTPEMYVIAKDGTIVYHGAIDNDRSARTLGEVNYVQQALDAYLAGQTVPTQRTQAYGCSVKYRN
ncbi:MAG: thioredoxin family protein [Phycisphaerales bacterium]|nr:MAG: thioredoxin family protein [Phycisphaerales bacterium]